MLMHTQHVLPPLVCGTGFAQASETELHPDGAAGTALPHNAVVYDATTGNMITTGIVPPLSQQHNITVLYSGCCPLSHLTAVL